MLLKLTGSSCSGKTTLAYTAAARIRKIAVHDFDELGVPKGVDRHWRHRMTEMWIRRALEYQERGIDLLLSGQSPLGEVLTAPSAPRPGAAGPGGMPVISDGTPSCSTPRTDR